MRWPASTDRLIEIILQEDRDVFRQLLTTDKVVATRNDSTYFGRRNSKEETQASIAAARAAEARQKEEEQAALQTARQALADLEQLISDNPDEGVDSRHRGPVDAAAVLAVARVRLWPWPRVLRHTRAGR